jgi:transposase
LLGLPEPWRMIAVEVKDAEKLVEIEVVWPESAKVPCPDCGRACGVYDHAGARWWRHLDTMGHTTRLCCRVPRSDCPAHGAKTIQVPWAGGSSKFTVEFEARAVELLLAARSQSQASAFLRMSWHQVHRLQEAAVDRGLKRRCTDSIRRVGLDEKSFGRGHHYGTVLSDLDQRRVLEVVEHREQASAEQALASLPEQQRENLQVVALDMWPPFMAAAKTKAPNADIVHDRFHVMKHLNEAVDKVRKQEHAELSADARDWLSGKKYLFLKSPETWRLEEKSCFQELQRKDLKVTKAWGVRETFQHFWSFDTRIGARKFFDRWQLKAAATKLRPVTDKARMLRDHLPGLLSYSVHKITNAVTEGFNSKIQMIKSAARGFRSFANYRVAILFHCGKLDLYPL